MDQGSQVRSIQANISAAIFSRIWGPFQNALPPIGVEEREKGVADSEATRVTELQTGTYIIYRNILIRFLCLNYFICVLFSVCFFHCSVFIACAARPFNAPQGQASRYVPRQSNDSGRSSLAQQGAAVEIRGLDQCLGTANAST